ncbi:hypothetical protein TPA0907_22820 [Micromonospora humidisoli]|nr:hypothetical protein TPA0907_22820 [Micromonospora sp. AKA109]
MGAASAPRRRMLRPDATQRTGRVCWWGVTRTSQRAGEIPDRQLPPAAHPYDVAAAEGAARRVSLSHRTRLVAVRPAVASRSQGTPLPGNFT